MLRSVVMALVLAIAAPIVAQPKKAEVTDKALAPWIVRVSALQAEDQVTAVTAKLTDVNPDYRGQKLTVVIEDGVVRELTAPAFYLRDIRPFKPLVGLEKLQIHGEPSRPSKISDLSPLRGMPLKSLSIQHTAVSDLSPLKGMALKELWCRFTTVRDLTVLKDMPLECLSLPAGISTAHVDSLKGKAWRKLVGENLGLGKKRLADLVANAKLDAFQDFSDPALDTLEPLRGMPLLNVLIPGSQIDSLAPLAESKGLWHLNVAGSRVKDLTPLQGLPITQLELNQCAKLSDLSPAIVGNKGLVKLAISFTSVNDFQVLANSVNLNYLDARGLNKIPTLKPLAGLTKLKTLSLTGTTPTDGDYTPLADLPLEFAEIDLNPKVVAVLKRIMTLQTVNGQPAAKILK